MVDESKLRRAVEWPELWRLSHIADGGPAVTAPNAEPTNDRMDVPRWAAFENTRSSGEKTVFIKPLIPFFHGKQKSSQNGDFVTSDDIMKAGGAVYADVINPIDFPRDQSKVQRSPNSLLMEEMAARPSLITLQDAVRKIMFENRSKDGPTLVNIDENSSLNSAPSSTQLISSLNTNNQYYAASAGAQRDADVTLALKKLEMKSSPPAVVSSSSSPDGNDAKLPSPAMDSPAYMMATVTSLARTANPNLESTAEESEELNEEKPEKSGRKTRISLRASAAAVVAANRLRRQRSDYLGQQAGDSSLLAGTASTNAKVRSQRDLKVVKSSPESTSSSDAVRKKSVPRIRKSNEITTSYTAKVSSIVSTSGERSKSNDQKSNISKKNQTNHTNRKDVSLTKTQEARGRPINPFADVDDLDISSGSDSTSSSSSVLSSSALISKMMDSDAYEQWAKRVAKIN